MSSCAEIDPLITPYLDDEVTVGERAGVEAHLGRCGNCRSVAEAERRARTIVRSRAVVLTPPAPAGLRARCEAALEQGADVVVAARSWGGRRWVPLSMAATVLLAVAGVIGYGFNDRLHASLATQLTLDHAKCFAIGEPTAGAESPRSVEAALQQKYGWEIRVPEGSRDEALELLGARRCLSSEGRVAHVMYRHEGRALSLFVLPGVSRSERSFDIMGYETVVWAGSGGTYALVGSARPEQMRRMVSYYAARVE